MLFKNQTKKLSVDYCKGNFFLLQILIAVILFFQSFSAEATIKIYVTLSPLHCLNCSANLYNICKLKEVKTIHLILESRFQKDSLELEEQFEFSSIQKIKLFFSDSLYNQKMRNQLFPEIILEENSKELFRENLTQIQNEKLLSYLQTEKSKNEITCIESIASNYIGILRVLDNYLIQRGNFDNYDLVDLNAKKADRIKVFPQQYESIYKTLLKDSFKYKYPILKNYFITTPVWKPKIGGVVELQNNIFVKINVKDYFPQGGDDTGIYGFTVLGKWDIKTNGFSSYYSFDKSITSKAWGPHELYFIKSRLYGKFISIKTDKFIFLELKINDKTNTISLAKEMPIKMPVKYDVIKVSSYYQRNIQVNGFALAFDHGDSLYIVPQNRYVHIPFDKMKSTNYEDRLIRDVYSNGKEHGVLYVENNHDYYLLRFNGEGKRDKLSLGSKESLWVTRFYHSINKLVFKNLETGCFEVQTFTPL